MRLLFAARFTSPRLRLHHQTNKGSKNFIVFPKNTIFTSSHRRFVCYVRYVVVVWRLPLYLCWIVGPACRHNSAGLPLKSVVAAATAVMFDISKQIEFSIFVAASLTHVEGSVISYFVYRDEGNGNGCCCSIRLGTDEWCVFTFISFN